MLKTASGTIKGNSGAAALMWKSTLGKTLDQKGLRKTGVGGVRIMQVVHAANKKRIEMMLSLSRKLDAFATMSEASRRCCP